MDESRKEVVDVVEGKRWFTLLLFKAYRLAEGNFLGKFYLCRFTLNPLCR